MTVILKFFFEKMTIAWSENVNEIDTCFFLICTQNISFRKHVGKV